MHGLQKKAILVVCDGLGDLPVKGKTPLQAARKPNINKLAREGATGLMHTLGRGVVPGSDTAHLALFGYDPKEFYCGRGPLEALGAGLRLQKGDIAFRANFATVKDGKLVDRRAGRSSEGLAELAKGLDGIAIEDVKIILKHTVEHRLALILRGSGLSAKVSDVDPEYANEEPQKCRALDGTKEAEKTARIVNEFVKRSQELEGNPINKERAKNGLLPANVIIMRGAGEYRQIPGTEERFGLKAVCVAGGALYKGVARYVGMDVAEVKGATGRTDTNLDAKVDAVISGLKNHDFVFLHIKGTDSCGHDGNFKGKKEMIERIDKAMGRLMRTGAHIILTGDHSTPVAKKRHTSDPCPILFWGENIRQDNVRNFDEFSCAAGGLGHLNGLDVMPMVLDLLDKAPICGA